MHDEVADATATLRPSMLYCEAYGMQKPVGNTSKQLLQRQMRLHSHVRLVRIGRVGLGEFKDRLRRSASQLRRSLGGR